jgi:hypothetical protein
MNIRLTDNYELRRINSLNWQLFEWREVEKLDKPASKGGRKTGEKVSEWVALDCFPRTIESACAWILENGNGYTRDESLTLAQAVDEFKRTADDLKHAVERAVRNG